MWKRTLLLITTSITLISAEKSYYSDANRSLYDSPRSRAMGGADMVISDEGLPSASPAGVVRADRRSIYIGYAGFYQNLFGATTLAFSSPIDTVQSVGASLSYTMIPGVDSVYREDLGEGVAPKDHIESVTSSELYLNMLYSRDIYRFSKVRFTAGAALHLKRKRLIDWTGYGIGADLAAHSYFTNGVALGLKVENFFTEYTHWSKNYSENGLPKFFFSAAFEREFSPKFGLALAYKTPDLFGNSGVGGGNFSTDGQFEDEPERLSVKSKPSLLFTHANYGTEFVIAQVVALRAGFNNNRMLNFGGGVHLFDRWDIDFVYSHSNALEGSYSVSTRIQF